MSALLDVAGLEVRFPGVHAVRGIDLAVSAGETHCLVGESGCGKSLSALALLGLLPRGARRQASRIQFAGQDLARLPERAMARLRGDRIAMIFQEPMTSLNPVYTIGSIRSSEAVVLPPVAWGCAEAAVCDPPKRLLPTSA